VGYDGSLAAECEIERRSADGSVTVARLKFDYRGR
jgi:hypothetical protein